jgi:predicted nuclease with TOPRIM domain
MKKEGSKLVPILIIIIVILAGILIYGVYTGMKVKEEFRNLNSQISNLVSEKNNLTSQLDSLQGKYNLLKDDVFEMKKSCLSENACKGRFPGVRWYCNNVGDEVSNYSHICVCDNACNLNVTAI